MIELNDQYLEQMFDRVRHLSDDELSQDTVDAVISEATKLFHELVNVAMNDGESADAAQGNALREAFIRTFYAGWCYRDDLVDPNPGLTMPIFVSYEDLASGKYELRLRSEQE